MRRATRNRHFPRALDALWLHKTKGLPGNPNTLHASLLRKLADHAIAVDGLGAVAKPLGLVERIGVRHRLGHGHCATRWTRSSITPATPRRRASPSYHATTSGPASRAMNSSANPAASRTPHPNRRRNRGTARHADVSDSAS